VTEDANEQAQQAQANEQAEQPEASPRLAPMYDPDLDAIELSQRHMTLKPPPSVEALRAYAEALRSPSDSRAIETEEPE
jgi:hypothetical protein